MKVNGKTVIRMGQGKCTACNWPAYERYRLEDWLPRVVGETVIEPVVCADCLVGIVLEETGDDTD